MHKAQFVTHTVTNLVMETCPGQNEKYFTIINSQI